jgi:hypothetical protein
MEPLGPADLIPFVLQHAREQSITPVADAELAKRSSSRQALGRDEVGYQVSVRYVATAGFAPPPGRAWQLPPYPPNPSGANTYAEAAMSLGERSVFPVTWQDTLTAAEVRSLQPVASAKVKTSWTPPVEVIKKLGLQLRPPTHYTHPSVEDITSLVCTATLQSIDGDRQVIALSGTL